ncbi:serine/threonine-protein kinase [Catenulispora subtropica]|uniref:non-specific serine/threonine protein kinase n=1 Tax=Catenulispora subtropica TaxID=450798 RepID=A0ABP5CRU2_9ACTN
MSASDGPTRSVAVAGRLVGGRYRLVDRLGSGGFGRVWRAVDTSLDVEVAIKEVVLPPELTDAERADRVTRAGREARNAARLRSNPHVVSVHDVVIDDGTPWIVMELVPGRSLADRLRDDGALTVEQATRVARAVLSALGASHAAGIVHRDVKPANVMLTDDGRVLLTDFGIAVLTSDTRLTTAGQFIGSVEYVAPERAKGEESRPAADMFSLGATLYHAVEGVSAFARETVAATLGAVLFEDVPAPSRAGALAPLIVALLDKDPDARPDVERALEMVPAEGAVPGPTAVVDAGRGSGGGAGVGAGAAPTEAAAPPAPTEAAVTPADGTGTGSGARSGPDTSSGSGSNSKARPPILIWAGRVIPFLLVAAMPFVPVLKVSSGDTERTYSSGLHVGFMESWHYDSGWPVAMGVTVYAGLLLALVFWVIPGMRRGWLVLGYLLALASLVETVVFAVTITGNFGDRRYALAEVLGDPLDNQSASPFIWYLPLLSLLTLVLYVRRDREHWRRLFRRLFIA